MVNLLANKHIRLDVRVFLALALSFLLFSMLFNVKPFIFMLAFCVMNALFFTYERYVELPLDLELSTFTTVLMTIKYGLAWGIMTGIMTKAAVILYNRDFNMNSIFTMSSYVIAALLAFILSSVFHANVVILGLMITLLANTYNFMVFRFINFLSNHQLMLYGISNMLFNFIVFIGFAEIVSGLMF